MSGPVVLLDLNFTLIGNSDVALRGFDPTREKYADRIAMEDYRGWLVDLLVAANATVHLITARRVVYERQTMSRIQAQLAWTPEHTHFNPGRQKPPDWKRRALHEDVFPLYDRDTRYVALESNAATRAMYSREGILAVKLPEHDELSELPRALPRSVFRDPPAAARPALF